MRGSSTIGKVAERTGLSVDAIRFYQKRGIVPAPARTPSGYRVFAEADIQDLDFIRRLQALGFSLSEIKELVALRGADHACPQVRGFIQRKVKDLRSKIIAMQELEQQLTRALRKCVRAARRTAAKPCPVLDEIRHSGGKVRR